MRVDPPPRTSATDLFNSPEFRGPLYMLCCNVVWVAEDPEKKDPYGRQLERQTSCSYGRNQSTPFIGMCWAWPDEEALTLAEAGSIPVPPTKSPSVIVDRASE